MKQNIKNTIKVTELSGGAVQSLRFAALDLKIPRLSDYILPGGSAMRILAFALVWLGTSAFVRDVRREGRWRSDGDTITRVRWCCLSL